MCDLHQYLVFLLCLAYCLCFNCVFGLTCKVAQRRCTRRFRTSSCFDRCGAVSMHLHCRFELLAPLDNPTGVVCSNGLPGVEANGVCCEAQCGECGGPGCGGRPGGPVRSCLAIFVSCLALCYYAPLAKRAVLFVPNPENGGKVAGTQSLTSWLASVWQENGHYSATSAGSTSSSRAVYHCLLWSTHAVYKKSRYDVQV